MSKLLFPIYVFVGGLGLFTVVCGAAWIYEKTLKKVEHPTLGTLTFYGNSWSGLKQHRDHAVRFELPGDKLGPSEKHVARFEFLWSGLESKIDKIRSKAIEEYLDVKDCYDEVPEQIQLISDISESLERKLQDFDKYWILSEIELNQEPEGKWFWSLDFEVAWDIEHTRVAYLDLDGQLLTYDLSCAVVDPWNPE